ncbi:MAG: DEAD/DEAH box helicase, partial [Armatimonadota bacterium]
LYTHQVEGIDAALDGQNTCIVTSTASGKTLCYLVPVAQALAQRASTRAIFIYPTKALAQDQLRKLADFGAGEAFEAETYDGDTPQSRRRRIKRDAQVILTNPDMLHVGILPYHHTWSSFLQNLQYIVIDEMHTYRGVFGAHTANVIRRLRRIAAQYGAAPQVVCCSATIGNPLELAEELTGLDFRLIDEDGSPQGRRIFGWWNPPVIAESTGRRKSPNTEAAELLSALARRRIRSITFTLSRTTTELILRYARDILREDGLQDRVMAYRGGYLPEQRRDIERRLFEGELLAVTSTTALELGVDIGGIDAVIMVGYPGSIASVWQQAGRAGRKQEDSLALLVAIRGGLHQYLMQHPEYLLEKPTEEANINPRNEFILAAHLLCAAYETPLRDSDEELFGPQMTELLELLGTEGFVTRRHGTWYWLHPEMYPAAKVSIRSISGEPYQVYEAESEQLLATVDADAAFREIHRGAIYLHAGESYRVQKLELEERRAFVEPVRVNYFTRPMRQADVHLLELDESTNYDDIHARYGQIVLKSQVIGFRRIRQTDGREIGREDLDLPVTEFETSGFWISSVQVREFCAEAGYDLAGTLHAVEHMLIALLPLFAMCDERDVGGASEPVHHDTGEPTIFIYDSYPGGVGIARGVYHRLPELLDAVAETIEACPCEDGCPGCVQSPMCGSGNEPLDKHGAAVLARRWADTMIACGKENGVQKTK